NWSGGISSDYYEGGFPGSPTALPNPNNSSARNNNLVIAVLLERMEKVDDSVIAVQLERI
ncbi:MAG: hypothetical protein AABZ06_00165, partial [Bdellovibrionota bacterium]